jgi:hypothetical protein
MRLKCFFPLGKSQGDEPGTFSLQRLTATSDRDEIGTSRSFEPLPLRIRNG